YWGEPIPIYFPVTTDGDPTKGAAFTIHTDEPIAVDVSELPLRLPELEDYQPGDDPAGVLARALDWRFFQKDGRWYARETNTMPQWAGSCWYYLRFMDPHNAAEGWSEAAAKRWLPVDLYVGGAEHSVLHLLYARFWHMVLFDADLTAGVSEPFQRLVHQGMILGEIEYSAYEKGGELVSAEHATKDAEGASIDRRDGAALEPVRVASDRVTKKGAAFVLGDRPEIQLVSRAPKMSKSLGNVVNPDDIIERFGADALRAYEMFMGPLEATKPWNTDSIQGVRRFLDRLWSNATKTPSDDAPPDALLRLTHKTIQKVGEDIEAMRFNTAISAMMVLNNELAGLDAPPRFCVETLVQLVHPFAPHIAEELWERLGHAPSIQAVAWPKHDPALTVDEVVEVPVQINGKVRGRVSLPRDADEAAAFAAVEADEGIAKQLEGKTLIKRIYVPGRIVTLVVKG
ncbi:MAG: class I tRNA ligase family protein, partial [Myxococcales bacterium]|nr:class I tRNA ligase family protein [Myxococcales bacterium]